VSDDAFGPQLRSTHVQENQTVALDNAKTVTAHSGDKMVSFAHGVFHDIFAGHELTQGTENEPAGLPNLRLNSPQPQIRPQQPSVLGRIAR
jgi:hypothetical protein